MTPPPEASARDALRAQLRTAYSERAHDLFAFAYRLVGSERAAEDVVHESVLRVLDGRCRLNMGRGDLVLLLFGVVRNVAREQRRQASREVQPQAADRHGECEHPERVLAVRAALDALSASDREVVILSAYHGYSPREIATVLGTSGLVIRVRLHRAKSRLRRLLLDGATSLTTSFPRLGARHD